MKKVNFGTLLITGGTGSFGESFLNKALNEFEFDESKNFKYSRLKY